MQPYPAYKDSGVEWLGKVPEHWDIRRLGNVGRFFKGSGGSKADETEGGVPCVRYGDLYTRHEFFITESKACVTHHRAEAYTWIRYGDVLFAGSGETLEEIGKSAVNLIIGSVVCGGDVIVFRPTIDLDAKFIGWSTDCRQAGFQKARMGRGITVMHIYSSALKRLVVPLPPLPEQTAIARFLDHTDRRIKRYIRAKEGLIELLEEQKQAIIHQAVTGQIDVRTGQPYPAYKDSGVELLGEVPEHWSVRRNRWLFRERNETGFGSLPVLEVSLHEGVGIRNMEGGQRKQQMVDRNRYKRAKTNDIAYNTMRMWQGAVGVVPVDGLVSPAYVVMAPVERIESRYFGYLFRTEAFKNAVKKFSRGIVSDRDRLYWDGFKRIASFVPPLEEQTAIVHFLDDLAARTDRLAHATVKLMGWLTERRESVISQVVTGKLDVREPAASLPEVSSLGADDIGRDPEGNVSVDPKALNPAIHPPHP